MSNQQKSKLAKLEEGQIGRIWLDDRWFYSVIDVVRALTESPDAIRSWRKLRQRLIRSGAEGTLNKIVHLKLVAPDGKLRETDCADTETMLRIIQSIPSPRAEPFKQWLAQIGASVVMEPTEEQKRIEYRGRSREINRELHDTVHGRGVSTPRAHAQFQDAGYRGLYGGETRRDIAERKGLDPRADIYEWMGSEELADNIFRAAQAQAMIQRLDVLSLAR